jgi:hypothetical protein
MKRLVLMVVAAFLMTGPAFAQGAKPAAKGSSKAAANKTLSAMGTVSAVSADSLTVKGKSGEWTFAVDDKTHVTARGASHKSAANKADNKPTPITDVVKVGDQVAVKYHDMGATKHAADVTVRGSQTSSAAKPKK